MARKPGAFWESMKLVEVALIGRLWSGTLVAGIWEGWLSDPAGTLVPGFDRDGPY